MNKKFIPKQPKGNSNKNLCLIYIFIILNYVILYIWRPAASDLLEMELVLAVRQWMWVPTMKPLSPGRTILALDRRATSSGPCFTLFNNLQTKHNLLVSFREWKTGKGCVRIKK